MTYNFLFFIHYAITAWFGILLSTAFAGIQFTRKNISQLIGLFVLSDVFQLIFYYSYDENTVRQIYPLLTHLPIVLLLCIKFHKNILTALASVTTAYLCCQPVKWIGTLAEILTKSYIAQEATCTLVLLAEGVFVLYYFAPSISGIYNKEPRNIFIFSMVPIVYYLYDYSINVYTVPLLKTNPAITEFLPFMLSIVHTVFCVIYYKEYELKSDAERKEQFIRITVNQQAKEFETVKRSEQEIRMLRHDMRLIMNSLSICIKENDIDTAQKMISGFTHNIDTTIVQRYCANPTVNYIISDCASKCQAFQIDFRPAVELKELSVDEIMFSSILSNALDNAFNAQLEMPEEKRSIKLMLKISSGRLLLSVKNPYMTKPTLVDGMPVSNKAGHGYGTQSIRYMTKRLSGNCQFIVEEGFFTLRIVI